MVRRLTVHPHLRDAVYHCPQHSVADGQPLRRTNPKESWMGTNPETCRAGVTIKELRASGLHQTGPAPPPETAAPSPKIAEGLSRFQVVSPSLHDRSSCFEEIASGVGAFYASHDVR